MSVDWQAWRARHPHLFAMIVILKRCRTKVGFTIAALVLGESVYNHEIPLDLDEPNAWVWAELFLILVGTGLRIAAAGCLRKKEVLATSGVYSLCRHPLYLGSILITYGFCCLVNDPKAFVLATAYFALFYTLAIIWEEIRLMDRYGDAHREYACAVPLILPLGSFRPGLFSLRQALSNGSGGLIAVNAVLLVTIEIIAETMRQ